MSHTKYKRLSARAPLDPFVSTLAAIAAERLSMPLNDWLESRLRACLVTDLAADFGTLPTTLRPHMHRWVQGQMTHPMGALPTGENLCELLGVSPLGSASSPAATASKLRLYDEVEMQRAFGRVFEKEHKAHYTAAMRLGPDRAIPFCGKQEVRKVESLLEQAPHFSEATGAVLDALAIARRARGRLRMPPILLSGPPGAGKTWWAREVASALGVPATPIAMPQLTASFVLAGSSVSWSQGRPGRIVETYMRYDCASPIFILDEVDRLSEGSYRPEPVLLNLLDEDSARGWRDEFFDIEFDVSQAIFIATANYPERMDPALRSRFREVAVGAPKLSARPKVIVSAWALHRSRYAGLRLPVNLPNEVLDMLAKNYAHLRDLQRIFDRAIARAARRQGRLRLMPSDFGAPAASLVPTVSGLRTTDRK